MSSLQQKISAEKLEEFGKNVSFLDKELLKIWNAEVCKTHSIGYVSTCLRQKMMCINEYLWVKRLNQVQHINMFKNKDKNIQSLISYIFI